jgi:hypothetical protein
MAGYEIFAIPEFREVICPKHRKYMKELRNGLLGEKLWYCADCDRPYCLAPKMLREAEFNREALDKQIRNWKENTPDDTKD